MEQHLLQKRAALAAKEPELDGTLSVLALLAEQDGQPLQLAVELYDTAFAQAAVSQRQRVCLWLGANVMAEYAVGEAVGMLRQKKQILKASMQLADQDLAFLREQVTTTEVSLAQVYNWAVGNKNKN